MKKIVPKINFSKKDFIKILVKCASCKRLLFIIFFGTLLIFTVDVVYKYAFINIEYVNYTKDNNFIITDGKINNVNLNRVLKNIDKNKEKIEEEINKKYRDPFSFDSLKPLSEFDHEVKGNNENENIDGDDLDDSKNLENDKNNKSDNTTSFEL